MSEKSKIVWTFTLAYGWASRKRIGIVAETLAQAIQGFDDE